MASEAQRAATTRYLSKLKTITTRMTPEQAEAVQAAASAQGESVNAYINRAIMERMERDSKGGALNE